MAGALQSGQHKRNLEIGDNVIISESDIDCVVLGKGLFSEPHVNGLAHLWPGWLSALFRPDFPPCPHPPLLSRWTWPMVRLARESKEGGAGGESIYSLAPSALASYVCHGRPAPATNTPRQHRGLSLHLCTPAFHFRLRGVYRLPVAAITDFHKWGCLRT